MSDWTFGSHDGCERRGCVEIYYFLKKLQSLRLVAIGSAENLVAILNTMHYTLEAILVGVALVLATYVSTTVTKKIVPSPSENFNKYHIMEISIFVAGVMTHVFFEKVGLNEAYCTSGHACMNK